MKIIWLIAISLLPLTGSAGWLDPDPEPPKPIYLEIALPDIAEEATHPSPIISRHSFDDDLITHATPIGNGRALLTLEKMGDKAGTEYVLIDAIRNKVIWRSPYHALGIALPGIMVFKVPDSSSGHTQLVAINQDGVQLWNSQVDHLVAHVLPLGEGVLLAKSSAYYNYLSAISVTDGTRLWKTDELEQDIANFQTINVAEAGLYVAGEAGLARLSPSTGKALWRIPQLQVNLKSLSPRALDDKLYLVSKTNELNSVDARDGVIRWRLQIPVAEKVTNIYPKDNDIYVRSQVSGARGAASSYRISRVSGQGKLLWQVSDNAPVVSNLVSGKGRLFGATPQELIAWDLLDGRLLYRREFAPLPSSYPPSVFAFKGQVVVGGELVIAGYEASSGKELYRHSFDPVMENGSVMMLDRSISKLGNARSIGGYNREFAYASSYFAGQSRISQERSNALSRSYQSKMTKYHRTGATGDLYAAKGEALRSELSDSFAKTEAIVSLQFMAIDNMLAYEASEVAEGVQKSKALMRHRMFLRKTILSEFPGMLRGDYIYRPVGIVRDTGVFMGVAVVHMPSGGKTETILSPQYREYGLWMMIGPDGKDVYYQGLGMDTSSYVWGNFGDTDAYAGQLIHQTIPIP